MKLLAILLLISFICGSLGCKCPGQPKTINEQYCSSDFMFKIKVTTDAQKNGTIDVWYETVVEKVFKGTPLKPDPQMKAPILSNKIYTPSRSGACGIALEKGQEYIVSGAIIDGKLRATSCGFHKKLIDLDDSENQFIITELKFC